MTEDRFQQALRQLTTRSSAGAASTEQVLAAAELARWAAQKSRAATDPDQKLEWLDIALAWVAIANGPVTPRQRS